MTVQNIWENCLQTVNNEFPKKQISRWMSSVSLELVGDNKLNIVTPNKYSFSWIKHNIVPLVQSEASRYGFTSNVDVCTASESKTTLNAVTNTDSDSSANLSLDDLSYSSELAKNELPLYKKYTFDNFVSGKSNQMAFAAAEHVAKKNNEISFNPLFIYGHTALGKTHLMCAVGNELRKRNPSANICFIAAEQFVADMVASIKKNRMEQFKEYYRSPNLLLIDDIQFFSRKSQSQEEFFHTFNWLLETGQQMIFTCDRYPKEIEGLEERLKSRFGSGLAVEVCPPEFETRVAILQKKAEISDIQLPYEVACYVGQHIKTNARELEGALKRLSASSMFSGEPITLELAKSSLRQLCAVHHSNVTIEQIQKEVADYQNIKVAELVAKRRKAHLVYARHLAMYLAKDLTNKSLPEIGEKFGGRDHTTVLHGFNKVKTLLTTSEQTKEDIKLLTRRLNT